MPSPKLKGRTFLSFNESALLFEEHRYHGTKVLLDEGGEPEHIGYVKECKCDAPDERQFAAFNRNANFVQVAGSTFEETARKLAAHYAEERAYRQSR